MRVCLMSAVAEPSMKQPPPRCKQQQQQQQTAAAADGSNSSSSSSRKRTNQRVIHAAVQALHVASEAAIRHQFVKAPRHQDIKPCLELRQHPINCLQASRGRIGGKGPV
jgi:hypothetical protein